MAVIASAHKISKTFGIQTLFKNITFSIEDGQKIGLIGPNGAGKSTLLQILSKRATPDTGDVSFGKNLSVGYLEQTPKFPPDKTVFDVITDDSDDSQVHGRAWELMSRLALEDQTDGGMKKVSELSGGWLKRVALARELIKQPQLLLLDEPTNHLDVESIQWLEDFLAKQYRGAYLIVTHDRLFLQNTCDMIFDLDKRNADGLIKFEGTYADFMELKTSLIEAQKTLFSAKKNTLRRETEWLRRGAKARQTKQSARINRAHDLKDEVKDMGFVLRDRTVDFDFGRVEHSPKKIIEVKDATLSRGGRLLFKDWNYLLTGRARVGIIGANGCGKTSLLKLMMAEIPPDSGSVKLAEDLKIAYFTQKKEDLDPHKSVLQTIAPHGDYVHLRGQAIYAKSYLSRFHFRPDQMDLPVGKISGGEQSRLLLAMMMLRSESVLILDEPTNDLDIETLDSLQEALATFEGAVILVTHDRYFMGQVCNEILGFEPNTKNIVSFADVFQWNEWFKNLENRDSKENAQSAPAPAVQEREKERELSAKGRKLSYKEQREFDGMEKTIADEEAKLGKMESEITNFANPSNYSELNKLTTAFQTQKDKVDKLYARWEELNQKINGV